MSALRVDMLVMGGESSGLTAIRGLCSSEGVSIYVVEEDIGENAANLDSLVIYGM